MQYCMISHVESKKIELTETEIRFGGCQRPGDWGQGKWVKVGKRFKLLVIR